MMRPFVIFLLMLSASYASGEAAQDAASINAEGVEFLKSGSNALAESRFRSALKLSPGIKHYYNNLGVSLMRQRRYREAAVFLRAAISIDPGYVKAISNLAITEFYLFHFNESLNMYRRAMSLDPEYAGERLNRKKALPRIKKLSQEYPENNDLKLLIEYLEESK